MDNLLHPEYIGRYARSLLLRRIEQVRQDNVGKSDPDVSIVIRTKNDISYIEALLADINAQEYSGNVEVILVDTESTDGTVECAKSHGAKVISITQADFTYPKALNLGFSAAKYPYVVTLVGHSLLSSRWFLRSLTRWYDTGQVFGSVYGWPMPGKNATRSEQVVALLWLFLSRPQLNVLTKPEGGMLTANSAIVSRAAWKQFDGFDERYAAGGEDGALGRKILAKNMLVVRDPLCAVMHSHGLGFLDQVRQIRHWIEVSKPLPFDIHSVNRRRPDMRQK